MPTIVTAVKGIIRYDNQMLIVQRAAADSGGGTWECPGGKVDFGEHPEASLLREIREETGFDGHGRPDCVCLKLPDPPGPPSHLSRLFLYGGNRCRQLIGRTRCLPLG